MIKNVLGVRIDDISEAEATDRVLGWISSLKAKSSQLKASKLIFTPGPEFIVEAQKDLEFKNILNASDLNLPDGIGLKFAGIRHRIPGVNFMMDLCREAEKKGWKIGLLGGTAGVAEETANKLIKIYPKIKIAYKIDGDEADKIVAEYINFRGQRSGDRGQSIKTKSEDIAINNNVKKIQLPEVEILFMAMGHFRQEKLLFLLKEQYLRSKSKDQSENLRSNLNSLGLGSSILSFSVGMGVGSSFEEIAGRMKTGPKWLSKIGLKWLGRLAYNPRHLKRVWTATGVFMGELLKQRLSGV